MRRLTGIRQRDLFSLEEAARCLRTGDRDLAMVGVARDCMLRPQEIVEVVWEDLTFSPEGRASLLIRGGWGEDPVSRPVNQATVQILKRLLGEEVGPLERIFPITGSQVNRRVAALCGEARLSGHFGATSPRIGMAEDLADADWTVEALREYGRWLTLDAAWGFVQRSRTYRRILTA